jgi:anti-sigma factor RsiW
VSFPLWQVTGLAASLAFAALVGFAWGNARSQASLLVDEAVSDHIRSLQTDHLTDVASTDQHTVRPWFAGKLDFSPPVADLAAMGFPLTGGRLEHIAGRPAAALIFHRRQHVINLFIWPVSQTAVAPRHTSRNGYNAETWSQAGLNFLAVSEIPATELKQFSETFRTSMR